MAKDPKRQAAGKRSRTKGQQYEREIAKILNEAFGWNLVRNLEQSRRDLHGDLVDVKTNKGPEMVMGRGLTHWLSPLFIECKNRPDAVNWGNVLEGRGNCVIQWVKEAGEKIQGEAGTSQIWLIFKSGTRSYVCCVNGEGCDAPFMVTPQGFEITPLDHFIAEVKKWITPS